MEKLMQKEPRQRFQTESCRERERWDIRQRFLIRWNGQVQGVKLADVLYPADLARMSTRSAEIGSSSDWDTHLLEAIKVRKVCFLPLVSDCQNSIPSWSHNSGKSEHTYMIHMFRFSMT